MKKKSLLDKLNEKKIKMQNQIQRGREVTEQKHAEKLRKQKEKTKYLQPGTFRYGLHHRQSITGFMKDVKTRRKNKRELKNH